MYVHFFFSPFYKMSSDGDVTLILFLVMGGVSAVATAVGGYFSTRKEECQAAFTPWTPCTDECDTEPTRSRKYVIQSGASACPYIDGYTETESCGPVTPCCEVERDWAPEGTCSTTGLQKFTRTLRERETGACEDFPKENFVPCCFEKGDWALDGSCGEHTSGKQRYKQTTTGCPVDKEYKYEDCAPCVGAWSNEIPTSCPTGCGFGGETFTKTWNVITEKIGTGTCPHVNGFVESLECDPTTLCPCPGNWSAFPSCPTECGQPQTTVYRFWQPGSKDGGKNYQSCPTSDDPKICPATPSCCVRTEWTPSGQCENGQQRQIRTVVSCAEDTDTMRFLPCCEYTPWTPSGQCENDLQAQVREEIENTGPECAKEEDIVLEQTLACCPYSAWAPSGQCVDDMQKQVRGVTTLASGEPCAPQEQETNGLERFMSCCGYSDWEPSGVCTENEEGTDAALAKVRSVIASTAENPCAPEETTTLSGADPCCIEQGDWASVGGCVDGLQKYEQTVVGSACAPDVESRYDACAPCEGSWSEAPCPTDCGLPRYDNIPKTWTTTTPAVGTGTCPTDADAPPAPTYSCLPTTPCVCEGEYDITCPTDCGYSGGDTRTFTQTGIVPGRAYGACPANESCPVINPCCEYTEWAPLETGREACVDGQIILSRTKINPLCVEDPSVDTSLTKLVPCQNCEGSWSAFPPCPTEEECGFGGGNVYKTWTPTSPTDENGYGEACPTGAAPSQYCPATSRCPCPGSWNAYPPCPTECGQSESTVTRTWAEGEKDPSKFYNSCPTTSSTTCPATSKCVTPDGTYFSYPADDYYARVAIGAKALTGHWTMATGYHEIGGNGPWYYSFTLPELIYIQGIGYEAHERTDVLPSSFEWYTINPDGSWNGPVTMSEITSTKANNYTAAQFRASKGVRGTLSKGLVFKINSYVLNPNDPTSGDDLDFRLNFGITGSYAGQFAT